MKLIRSVSRALEILEVLNQNPSRVGDLMKCTGLPRTTTMRVLRTLESSGYVFMEEVRGAKIYFVSPKTKMLSCGTKAWYEDYVGIKVLLAELGRDLEWPVYFSVNDGFDMEVVESTENESPFFLKDSILGDRLSLLRSAPGLAFLSVCNPGVRERFLEKTSNHIDGPEDLHWIQSKISATEFSGCVCMDDFGGTMHDRPVASMAIGLRNSERAFGSVSMRYYSKAYLSDGMLSKWSRRLVSFADKCRELTDAPKVKNSIPVEVRYTAL